MYGRFFIVVLSLFLLLATSFCRHLGSHSQAAAAEPSEGQRCPDMFVPVSEDTGLSRLVHEIPNYCRRHHAK